MEEYNKIKSILTLSYLQTISRHIIDFYKARKFSKLDSIYSQLYPSHNRENQGTSYKKLFFTLIKLFHPDTLSSHLQKIKTAIKDNHQPQRTFYQRFISIQIKRNNNNALIREAFAPDETYGFEQEDLDHDSYYADSTLSEDEVENDIISIISSIFLGNASGHRLDPIDLSQIDAELILSDRGIYDLDGLQHCKNLIRLDLSDNKIDNIYEIQFLPHLEELDLSHNNIHTIDELADLTRLETLYLDDNILEDISILTTLENLEFVSIVNNPITSMDAMYELRQKGVIVLYF